MAYEIAREPSDELARPTMQQECLPTLEGQWGEVAVQSGKMDNFAESLARGEQPQSRRQQSL